MFPPNSAMFHSVGRGEGEGRARPGNLNDWNIIGGDFGGVIIIISFFFFCFFGGFPLKNEMACA